MKKVSVLSALTALFFAAVFGVIGSLAIGISPIIGVGILLAVSVIPMRKGVAFAGVIQEVWIKDIQESLNQNAEFIKSSTDHSSYVAYGIVHIPQSGANPAVVTNRSALPANITQRPDTDNNYNLNQYSTDPILITNIDELQTAYDKRQSVMGQQISILTETIGTNVANSWAGTGSANIVRTTGAASANSLAPGATGTRLLITLADVAAMGRKLDKDNIPSMGRKLLMNADMFWDLFSISDIVRASYNGFQAQGGSVLSSGIVARLLGFDIYVRPTVAVYATGTPPTLKAVGAATAITDNLACIAWHPSVVSRAESTMNLYAQSGDNGLGAPEYYGIILSMSVMLGSAKMRADQKGIVSLVQANS